MFNLIIHCHQHIAFLIILNNNMKTKKKIDCEDDIHETAATNELIGANADENVSDEIHSNCVTSTIFKIKFRKQPTSGDSNGCKRLLCPAVSRRRNETERNQFASETVLWISASVPAAPVKRTKSGGKKIVHSRKQLIFRAFCRRCKRTVHNQPASETLPCISASAPAVSGKKIAYGAARDTAKHETIQGASLAAIRTRKRN